MVGDRSGGGVVNVERRRCWVAEGFERTTRELNEERAAALRSVSCTLESLIDKLHAARTRIATVPDTERPQELAAYRELRRKAKQYRWYLEVQREALGLRQHHHLDEFYRIPDALD
jgi:hypothetical protein